MTNLLNDRSEVSASERKVDMSKVKQKNSGSELYKRIRDIQMSEADRQTALNAVHQAEAIADAMIWVKGKLAAVSTYFLKPSLKH